MHGRLVDITIDITNFVVAVVAVCCSARTLIADEGAGVERRPSSPIHTDTYIISADATQHDQATFSGRAKIFLEYNHFFSVC